MSVDENPAEDSEPSDLGSHTREEAQAAPVGPVLQPQMQDPELTVQDPPTRSVSLKPSYGRLSGFIRSLLSHANSSARLGSVNVRLTPLARAGSRRAQGLRGRGEPLRLQKPGQIRLEIH